MSDDMKKLCCQNFCYLCILQTKRNRPEIQKKLFLIIWLHIPQVSLTLGLNEAANDTVTQHWLSKGF